MRFSFRAAALLIALTITCLVPGYCRAAFEYIDITSPSLRKIPLAVPIFKSLTPNYSEDKIAVEGADLLASTLDFTGYFKLLDRGAFLEDPRKTGLVPPTLKLTNWTTIGAELLVTAGVSVSGTLLEMELRLYDTFKGRLVVGKRYTGYITDQRKIIRRFCSEVIFELTGNRGIFSSKIAFVSTGTKTKEIYTCDFDGYDPMQLTRSRSITLSPAWSWDGQWLAYTSYEKGNPDLFIRHLNEKRGTVVSKKGINITPAWVPNQFALAATLSFSGDQEIYLLTGSGEIIKNLTSNWGIDVSPSWSPDGKQMAFVSDRAGSPQIYIKNIDSGEARRLTFEGKYNTSPSWSPKGDKIAYESKDNGNFNIRVIGVDGAGLYQLTNDAGDNESPSWAPDGSLIAFSSTREGPSRIFIMTAFGTDQRRLLALPGEQTNPSWSPNIAPN
ncbi:MAG: Tol-Pal system beta propeller repeat protein TolB [Desulfobacterales bacterium]|jgi:TolB protein|nr:Tol-Pal system beta propeller repeat protein TolB [Desulfobacterales bacterium]